MGEQSAITINGRATIAMAAALLGIGQAVAVYCLLQVVDLKTTTAATQANRWTSKDQANFMREHQQTHAELPPLWLRHEIERQAEEDKRLQVQIDRLESKWLGESSGDYVP